VVLSNAERQRRYINRLKARAQAAASGAEAIGPLKAHIRELEAELAHERNRRKAAEAALKAKRAAKNVRARGR